MINYYQFDSITRDEDGQYWGHLNGQSVEVYEIEGDTDYQLIEKGFAKCDAPGTETFSVEETAWCTIASLDDRIYLRNYLWYIYQPTY